MQAVTYTHTSARTHTLTAEGVYACFGICSCARSLAYWNIKSRYLWWACENGA